MYKLLSASYVYKRYINATYDKFLKNTEKILQYAIIVRGCADGRYFGSVITVCSFIMYN